MAESRRGAHVRPSTRSSFRKPSRSIEAFEEEEESLPPPSRAAGSNKRSFGFPGGSARIGSRERVNIEDVPRISRSELREAMSRTLDPSSRPAAADTAAPSSRSAARAPARPSARQQAPATSDLFTVDWTPEPSAPPVNENPRPDDADEAAWQQQSRPTPETEADKAAARAKRRRRRLRDLRSLLLRMAFLLLVVYVLFFHVVGIMIMPNGDMSPRLETGDLVLFFRLNLDVHSGDVVVLEKYVEPEAAASFGGAVAAAAAGAKRATAMDKIVAGINAFDRAIKALLRRPIPTQPGETYVSRVIAAPGDTVDITDGERVLVNGNALIESNIFYSTPEYLGFVEYPVTLGPDEYFVLSDHRQGGADSRFFGPVKENDILGVVITVARRNNL